MRHRPRGWTEHPYVVVRRHLEDGQGQLLPVHTVILVSRDDLLPKSARKHRLRPLIRHFIRTVARLVKAAGRRCLDFAKSKRRRTQPGPSPNSLKLHPADPY